jgi:tetratricopeptide (TPR) repeat protein
MAESAAELEQRAERAVRRGELLAALQLFEELIVREPRDGRVRQRMESVRALLQPAELSDRRPPEPEPEDAEPRPAAGTLTDAEQGELHASAGRFVEALRWYQRAASAAPDNELVRERLDELRELAPPGARADLASAEQLPAHPSAHAPQRAARSHKVAHASFAPLDGQSPPQPLPRDPVKMLEALLERIRAGRRGAPTRA